LVHDALVFREPLAHGVDSIKDLAAKLGVWRRLAQLTITLTRPQSYATPACVFGLADESLQEIGAGGFGHELCVVRWKQLAHIDHHLRSEALVITLSRLASRL